jgi:hypothetical protein
MGNWLPMLILSDYGDGSVVCLRDAGFAGQDALAVEQDDAPPQRNKNRANGKQATN